MFVAASKTLIQRDRTFVPLQIEYAAPNTFGEGARLHWLHVGTERFSEPFFHQSLHRHLLRPFNRLFRPVTLLSDLVQTIAKDSRLEICGFIFHVSRCGSTLLSQMLGQDPANTVLSEPEVLDQLLRLGQARGEHDLELVRALVMALGRNRHPQAKRCIIKLDSWHAQFAPVLRAAFPDVPWVVLYREPSEVYGSNLARPSSQMVPGTLAHLPPGMSLLDAIQLPHTRYVAIKLAQIYQAVWGVSEDPRALLVNYDALPQPGFERVLQHFDLRPARQILEQMRARGTHDAKHPGTDFQADGAKKRALLGAQEIQDCTDYLVPIYQCLEQRRVQNDR